MAPRIVDVPGHEFACASPVYADRRIGGVQGTCPECRKASFPSAFAHFPLIDARAPPPDHERDGHPALLPPRNLRSVPPAFDGPLMFPRVARPVKRIMPRAFTRH